MGLLLGVDFGTGGVRIGAYDLEKKRLIVTAEAPYDTDYPRPAWAEQNPTDWWAAFIQATNQLFENGCPTDIDTITIAATSSTVVVTKRDGTPLRPAILWMDARAAEESSETGTVKHPVMDYSGGSDAVEWLVPKAMWLARNEPSIYAEADIIAEKVDYINFQLTGEWAASQLNATCKWNYDTQNGKFHTELFAKFGIPDLEEKIPQRVVPVGQIVGEVKSDVAERFGFSGIPKVVQGGIDAHISMLGAATIDDGDMLMVGGTSVVHLCHTKEAHFMPGIWGPYPHALLDGYWIIEGGQVSGGSVINWLVENIYGLDRDGHRELIAEATKLEACSTGLLALDHWMGNRTPYRDPRLRGAILGITLSHDRVALYRATVEAVALGTGNVVRAFAEGGVQVDRVVVSGGIRHNLLWLQASADALGLPLYLTRDPNLALVAGAVAGAYAVGVYDSLSESASELVAYDTVIEPNMENHKQYSDMLDQYCEATERLTPVLHKLADSVESQRE